jgi:hypothetical protein
VCLSADWAGMLILPNSFLHCFVWCVWVRTFRPCISCLPWMSLLWLAVACVLLVWFSSLVLQGSSLFAAVRWFWCGCCLLSCLIWRLGCLRFGLLFPGFPLPSPLVVFWYFLVQSVLLVPPSGYLVVFATVRLSYLWHGVSWLIGSCLHSASWQQRLRPCVGLCPLHHVVGVVHVPLAPALRYSPSGDPESP